MKKILFITFLLLLFFGTIVSAIDFNMKNSFDKEECLIAKLSGEFVNPPLAQNINFYRGHVRIGIDSSFNKIGDDYYLFAPLSGKTQGNYSIVIKDISYKKAGKIIEQELTKNFTITNNTVDFIIDKGFIDTKNDFYIELENLLNEDLEITLNITTISGSDKGITSYEENTNYDLLISPGTKKIDFKTEIKEQSIKLIQFVSENNSYVIPVYLFQDPQITDKIFGFKIEPSELDVTLNVTSQRKKMILIYNQGTGTLTDVKVTLSDSLYPYVTISENSFGQILPENNAHFNITMRSSGTDGYVISGELLVETEQGVSDSIKISVTTEKGYIPSPEEQAPDVYSSECESKGGKICSDDEECTSTTFPSKKGICCAGGECKPIPEKSPLGKIIGWTILGIIVLVGIWFFLKKYKKVNKPIDLLKIAKGKK